MWRDDYRSRRCMCCAMGAAMKKPHAYWKCRNGHPNSVLLQRCQRCGMPKPKPMSRRRAKQALQRQAPDGVTLEDLEEVMGPKADSVERGPRGFSATFKLGD